jgi:F-type H+-transporting ATPase subunit b
MMTLATAFILAAEEEGGSGIDLLVPDTAELITGIIAFTIVFIVMWRLAVPWFNRTIEARQQAIKSELEMAETAKVEAEALRTQYEDHLSGAREEAARIVEQARKSGEETRGEILAKAKDEADEVGRKARQEIDSERSKAQGDMRKQVATLSLDVAERVVGRELDRDSQQQLVERFIDELGG